MLKPLLSILPALVVVVACTNYPGAHELETTPAPSFEALKADIDRSSCSYSTSQVSFGLPKETSERPAPTSGCPAYFPRHFLYTTLQGSCASMFDLDDAGKIINLETRCNVGSPRKQPPDDWSKIAEEAFIYSIATQLRTWVYPVKGSETASQRRHSIFVGNDFGHFTYEFAPKAYPPFQRPAPAPALPPDLVEKIAEYAADS